MHLARYLAHLGYGSRREVEQMLRQSRVTNMRGMAVREGEIPPHDSLLIDGEPLDPPQGSVVMLNKPVGYVCSTSDRPPTVYDLLPARFPMRSPVMATVGRLDAATSGLLLLTDDGALNHRVTSPRTRLRKTYRAVLSEPSTGAEGDLFASGTLMLHGETAPLLPASLTMVDSRTADITITEGRYHQVRRMFAAVGKHVIELKRIALGPLTLAGLPEGRWCVLTECQTEALRSLARRSAGAGPDAASTEPPAP